MNKEQKDLVIELFFHLQSANSILTELKDDGIKDIKFNRAVSTFKIQVQQRISKIIALAPEVNRFYANMEKVFRTFKELDLDDKMAINIKRDLMYQALENREILMNQLEGFIKIEELTEKDFTEMYKMWMMFLMLR